MKLSDSSIPLPSVDDRWLEYDKLAWEKKRMSYEPWAERCPSCNRMLGVQNHIEELLTAVRIGVLREVLDVCEKEGLGSVKDYLRGMLNASVPRSAPNVEDCPDFKLPAHFTFDPHNKEEQAEIQRRVKLHAQTCTRCGMSNTLTRTDALIAEINERQRLEREVIKAAKLWRKYRIGANEVELEWAVRDLDEHETKHR